MAKIDVKAIEGYENMTAEEKLAALEGFELPDPDFTGYVKKDLLDRANSEAAAFKRQLREKMTEEEAAKAKAAEDMAAIQQELETLRMEKTVTDMTKRWMGVGYSEELATATAKAMAAGEMDTVFKNHAKFLVDREKALKAELLKQTPAPAAGGASASITKKQFDAMGYTDRMKLYNENQELYNELNGGN